MRWFAVFLLAAWLLLPMPALAEDSVSSMLQAVDMDAVQSVSDDSGLDIDVGKLMEQLSKSGGGIDVDAFVDQLKGMAYSEIERLRGLLLALAIPMFIWALLQQITGGANDGPAFAAGYVCYLTASVTLIGYFVAELASARATMGAMASLTEALFPALTALLVASGGTVSAQLFTPAAALASGFVSNIASRIALTLAGCVAALMVAGNMNEKIRLKGLTKLILSVVNWSMGILMTAFIGLMTVQGILGAGYDGVSINTARYTVDNLLPIIGGEVADTMDVMVSSAKVVKNAAGVTGLMLLIALSARPIIRLLLSIIAVKLAAALVEPIADGPIAKLVSEFSGVFSMILVSLVTCTVMLIVLIGAVFTAGRAIVG